ncbi:KIR-like protein [Plasmodium coatneyi]|uniref:KIR-like protein n=1 Tax=Plasmodium coatneyi TaxID=208452 RepID=A0A1B1DTK9_9APIC|nr:KIR-like protein [Plasmodium coatneyi]ANQ06118.1 KIR-like protein [Plasmodium coatneyi]
MLPETVNPLNPQSFPSYKDFYNIFENGGAGTCTGGCQTDTQISGRLRGKIEEHSKVPGSACYACKVYKEKDSKPPKKEAYHFLYYWIGDKLSKSKTVTPTFQAVISAICGDINNYCGQGGSGQCKIPCDDEPIGRDEFKQRKKVFDYYYDYNTVMGVLGNGESPCDAHWSSYLTEASAACNAVRTKCAADSENKHKEYCTEFNRKYDLYCDMIEVPKLKCALESLQNRIVSEVVQKASSIANDAYNLLPSWFSNHSSGGGRKSNRRRRSTGNNLDVSTEDSSTIASTFDSTEYSTAYTTRPSTTREGRENSTNRRGQEQQQGQNISYHSM